MIKEIKGQTNYLKDADVPILQEWGLKYYQNPENSKEYISDVTFKNLGRRTLSSFDYEYFLCKNQNEVKPQLLIYEEVSDENDYSDTYIGPGSELPILIEIPHDSDSMYFHNTISVVRTVFKDALSKKIHKETFFIEDNMITKNYFQPYFKDLNALRKILQSQN